MTDTHQTAILTAAQEWAITKRTLQQALANRTDAGMPMQAYLEAQGKGAGGGRGSDTMTYVNPARVWLAKSMRELTTRKLAEAVGETPGTVAKWIVKDGYQLDLTGEQLERLSFATRFPVGFFLQGDENEDFDNMNNIGKQMFGSQAETIGVLPCRRTRSKS